MLIKNKLDKGTSGGRDRLSLVPTYLSTLLHKVNCCVNCPHMSQLVSNTYVAVQCYCHRTYTVLLIDDQSILNYYVRQAIVPVTFNGQELFVYSITCQLYLKPKYVPGVRRETN